MSMAAPEQRVTPVRCLVTSWAVAQVIAHAATCWAIVIAQASTLQK